MILWEINILFSFFEKKNLDETVWEIGGDFERTGVENPVL